jgi:hypothetical protein
VNKIARMGIAVAACAFALPASAEIVDFSVGNNSFRLAVLGPLSRLLDVKGQYEVGGLMRPKRDDDLLVTHVGAMLTGDAGFGGQVNVAAGVGLRALYIGRDDEPGGAVAAGGQVEARYPGFDRLGLSAYGYGAPGVTSFGHVDSYYEIGVGLDYQILKDASVYGGWRNVHADFQEAGDLSADHSLHVGVRLNFGPKP